MDRRKLITGAAALTTLMTTKSRSAQTTSPRSFLELKTWRLHNSREDQLKHLSDYLETGLFPALTRAGAKPIAALTTTIGPDTPTLLTIVQHASLAAFQNTLATLEADTAQSQALQQLISGSGLPFVTTESTLLHNLSIIPEITLPAPDKSRPARIFELRTYQNQSTPAQQKKAAMFNDGEIAIFQRLGMNPIFIGEAIVGPHLPNITYMLAFENLAAREKLWQQFGSDPEWKKLSGPPELKDPEIVANISNTILAPRPFSPLR
jgi:NIPSNAP